MVELMYYTPQFELELGMVARVSRNSGYATFNKIPNDTTELTAKTLRFCVKAGHLSVLEFAQLVFRIECPIFVARQLMRYRNASYIERSLRYCEPTTREFMKEIEDPEAAASAYGTIVAHEDYSRTVYDELVMNGAKKEYARAVLPLSTMTLFLMRVDLRELLHIFDERLTPQCQKETREVVEQMYKITKKYFPIVMEEYENKSCCNSDRNTCDCRTEI
ncbi:MAG: FAD-dependent thymidylate synthase [Thermoguttaceae bacterium]|nr:FAD-dependent thymidylate synthase [Thermoguttaceae bacterium]